MADLGDTLVERYRLDGRIGAGGFATVFLARDLRLGRDVAVKVLSPTYIGDPVVVGRFDREARTLAAFSHPNVVAIHDVEPPEPTLGAEAFLVMDLCEGGSLATRMALAGSRGLSPDVLVPILIDVAAGLEALHAAGMVHRDVKPSNVLLSGGRALIADLGIAAAVPGETSSSGDAIGTLAYLAPEQLAGAQASPASDVHALGVVAFLGFTGRLPRPARSMAELVAASSSDPPSVSSLAGDLGSAFDWPVASAMARAPIARPTVQQFAWRLERGLERWQETVALQRIRLNDTAPVVIGTSTTAAMASARAGDNVDRTTTPSASSPDDPTVVVGGATTTAVLVESGATAPTSGSSQPAPKPDAPRTPLRRPARWVLAVGGLALAVVLVTALALVFAGGRPSGGAGAEPSAIALPTASREAATADATPSTSAESPTHPDPYAVALEASARVRDAVAAARGRAGLNGRAAKDLGAVLDRFVRALDARDVEAAVALAGAMADDVGRLLGGGKLSKEAAARLQAAVKDTVEAANALPR